MRGSEIRVKRQSHAVEDLSYRLQRSRATRHCCPMKFVVASPRSPCVVTIVLSERLKFDCAAELECELRGYVTGPSSDKPVADHCCHLEGAIVLFFSVSAHLVWLCS